MSRFVLQAILYFAVAAVGGAAGALLVPPLLHSDRTDVDRDARGADQTSADLARIEQRLSLLEEEASRPRLTGQDIGERIAGLEARLRALEDARTSSDPAVEPAHAGRPDPPADEEGQALPVDELLAKARTLSRNPGERVEERLDLWKAIIAQDPPNEILAEAWEGVAAALRTLRRWADAEAAYREVIMHADVGSNRRLYASFEIAVVQMAQGDKARSRETMTAFAQDPIVPQPLLSHAWFHVAKLSEELGDVATARRAYQRVVGAGQGADLLVVRHLADKAQQRLNSLDSATTPR